MIITSPLSGSYTRGFRIKGHAGYAEHGQDIVCASVSALALGLTNYLTEQGIADVTIEPGLIHTKITHIRSVDERVINAFMSAIQMISMQYPDHSTFNEGEKDNEN